MQQQTEDWNLRQSYAHSKVIAHNQLEVYIQNIVLIQGNKNEACFSFFV